MECTVAQSPGSLRFPRGLRYKIESSKTLMSPVRSKTAPRSAKTRTETADVPLKRKALSLALFLIVAASMLNALFGDRGLLELLRARQEIESLDREIATLRAQNQGLLGEIRDLKTSPLAVERLARENLALVKPVRSSF